MSERVSMGPRNRQLQIAPGLSLIGRAVKFKAMWGSVLKRSTKAPFKSWRVFSGHTYFKQETRAGLNKKKGRREGGSGSKQSNS
jgi:hypothetical protein